MRGQHPTLGAGENTRTSWTVFGQHLTESNWKAQPDLSHTETGGITQTLVSQRPPYCCGSNKQAVRLNSLLIHLTWYSSRGHVNRCISVYIKCICLNVLL